MNNSIGDQNTLDGTASGSGASLAPGAVLGQYLIIRLLGCGGMGEVYEAEHQVLRRRYALKLLPATLNWQGVGLERFQREAQVMAKLEHPNILKVDDFGEAHSTGSGQACGRYWLRMELAGGVECSGKKVVSLQDLADARGGKVPQGELLGILKQILAGLDYAHEHGAIHRDLKPSNILLFPNPPSPHRPIIKIADFGLVRLVGEEWVRSQAQLSVQKALSIGDQATLGKAESEDTSKRSLLGTYEYMSPEQRRGEEADARSDLYAVGLIIFKLLTGHNPGTKPPSRIDPTLAPGWDKLLDKALEDEADQRVSSASSCLALLTNIESEIESLKEAEPATDRCEGNPPDVKPLRTKEAPDDKAQPASRQAGNRPTSRPGGLHPTGEAGTLHQRNPTPRANPRSYRGLVVLLILSVIGFLIWRAIQVPELKSDPVTTEKRETTAEAWKATTGERDTTAEAWEATTGERETTTEAQETTAEVLAVTTTAETEVRSPPTTPKLLVGSLYVSTEPAGAQVRVGHYGTSNSPAKFRGLPSGKVPVQVEMDGYDTVSQEVEIPEDDWATTHIQLVPKRGTLELISFPAGARIMVNGYYMGITPKILEVEAGLHTVEFSKPGWRTARLTAQEVVSAQKTTVPEVRLVQESGHLRVKLSVPGEARSHFQQVEKQSRIGSNDWKKWPAGEVEYTQLDLPVGSQMVEVKAEGYAVARVDPSEPVVRDDQSTDVEVLLSPLPGQAIIAADPPEARVEGAGVRARAGQPVALSPFLAHAFAVSAPGYYATNTVVTLDFPGQVVTQRVVLAKIRPADLQKPFENSLGMKFIPVPGVPGVLFSVWETRVQDFRAFRSGQDCGAGDLYPAVKVSWDDAVAFCDWLTRQERALGRIGPDQAYRLPKDWEWSVAAGLTERKEGSPQEKDGAIRAVYPWAGGHGGWPPKPGDGNYHASLKTDSYEQISPVGRFAAHANGLFDLGGNVWEWCADFYDGQGGKRVLRGGSWQSLDLGNLLTSYRYCLKPDARADGLGVRVVLASAR